jgi:hypothetical protein
MRCGGLIMPFALCALASQARAQEFGSHGPALNWVRHAGAESCIASVELAQLVEVRLGRTLFVAAPDALIAIEGAVRPSAQGGFDAEIAVSDGRGTLYGNRELHAGSDCRELDEALALVIAVTLRPAEGGGYGIELPPEVMRSLDTLFGDEPADPEPQALPIAQADHAGERPSAPVHAGRAERPAPAPVERDGAVFGVELGPWMASGLQPERAFGPALGFRVQGEAFGSVRLRGALSLVTSHTVRDGNMRGETRFQVWRASLAYCTPELGLGPVAGALCGGAGLGATSVDAEGFSEHNRGARRFWVAPALDAELRLGLVGPLSLLLALGAEVRVPRAQFVYAAAAGASDEVFRADWVGVTAWLALSIRLF